MAWRSERRGSSAARAGDRVEIDVVRHFAVLVIVQVEFHLVPFADADEFSGHIAAEGPKDVLNAVGQAFANFLDFEIDDDFGFLLSGEWRGDVWGGSQDGVFDKARLGRGFLAGDAGVNAGRRQIQCQET